VLMINALLTAVFVAICATFTPLTPVWLMILLLLIGGFFRSLQFTGVNTLTYADISSEAMSRASSFAAMAQQLAISLGVGVAAFTLNMSMTLRGHASLDLQDVANGFIVVGLFTASSFLFFRRLAPDAGAQLNSRHKREKKAEEMEHSEE